MACQFEFLQNLTSEEEYHRALESLPPDLPATYERMLEKILKLPESTQRMVQEALKWIIFAFPSLNLSELCEAVSVEAGSAKRNPRNIVKPTTIERYCSSFVRKSTSGNLESAHFTVKEFFTNLNQTADPRFARFSMQEESVRASFASTCLTYLNYEDFRRPVPDHEDEISQYPFYTHATVWFIRYARESWHRDDLIMLGKRLFEDEKSSNFILWCHYFLWNRVVRKDILFAIGDWKSFLAKFQPALRREQTSTLYWAALIGVPQLVEANLSSGSNINRRLPLGTPLHAAILGELNFALFSNYTRTDVKRVQFLAWEFLNIRKTWNHQRKSCVQLLLSHGADCNIPLAVPGTGDITTHELLFYSGDAELITQLPKPNTPLNEGWLKRLQSAAIESWRSHPINSFLDILNVIDLSKVPMTCEVDYANYAIQMRAEADLKYEKIGRSDISVLLRVAANQGSIDVINNILTLRGVDVDSTGEDGETALHLAARNGSRQCMEALIDKGASINKRDTNGRSALHYAAWSSSVECVDMLLGLGLDPREKTSDSKTLCHLAAERDNVDVLQMLFERFGEDILYPNDRDVLGRTPILTAANNSSPATLRFLLPFSNPNDKDSDDEPLLHLAATHLGLSHITTIMERGADPLVKCGDGSSILHHMATNSKATREYFQMALDLGVSKDAKAEGGASPLHVLLRQTHFQINPDVELAEFLASETNINTPDEAGVAPLHHLLDAHIVIDVKLRLFASFLRTGSDVTLKTDHRDSFFRELVRRLPGCIIGDSWQEDSEWRLKSIDTQRLLSMAITATHEVKHLEQPLDSLRPLQWCLVYDSLALQLLSKGVNPNLRDTIPGGLTPLEAICTKGAKKFDEGIVLRLCEAYKKAPSLHPSGDTLLHMLCHGPSLDVVLLNHIHELFPDVNIRGADGSLSLIDAISNGKVAFVEQLLSFGARLDLKGGKCQRNWYPVHYAVQSSNYDILSLLWNHEADWSLKIPTFSLEGMTFAGWSVLHIAVRENSITAMNFLLDRGLVDVNVLDDFHRTPLHIAARFADEQLVTNLIDRGADTKALDKEGNSALHYSVFNIADHEHIITFLVDNGCPQGLNKSGETPMILAICQHRMKAVEIFDNLQSEQGMFDRFLGTGHTDVLPTN